MADLAISKRDLLLGGAGTLAGLLPSKGRPANRPLTVGLEAAMALRPA